MTEPKGKSAHQPDRPGMTRREFADAAGIASFATVLGLVRPALGQQGSIRISGVSRGRGLNGGGGVVSEARVPSFEQWPKRAVERACPDL
jgi:hypothetical protein